MILVVSVLILILMIIVGIIFINASPQFGAKTTGESYERIISSKNYEKGKFRNVEKSNSTQKNNIDSYKKKLSPKVKAVWFGHSALLLEVDNKKIFLDPMLGYRASPLSFIGPKRFKNDFIIKIEDIPNLDAVLISQIIMII